MNYNKIGNIILALVAVLLQLLYFGALVAITAEGPNMLANVDSQYITPYSNAQLVLIAFIFVTEIVLFVAVAAFISDKKRLIGEIGVISYILVIIFDVVFVYTMIEQLIATADPGVLASIRLMFYIIVIPPFFGIAGGVLKVAFPE